MAVTSQERRAPGFGEVLIQEWRGAGLIKPSVVKPVVFTAEKHIVLKRLVSVITVIEGAIFEEFEGPRSKRMYCPPASVPA